MFIKQSWFGHLRLTIPNPGRFPLPLTPGGFFVISFCSTAWEPQQRFHQAFQNPPDHILWSPCFFLRFPQIIHSWSPSFPFSLSPKAPTIEFSTCYHDRNDQIPVFLSKCSPLPGHTFALSIMMTHMPNTASYEE